MMRRRYNRGQAVLQCFAQNAVESHVGTWDVFFLPVVLTEFADLRPETVQVLKYVFDKTGFSLFQYLPPLGDAACQCSTLSKLANAFSVVFQETLELKQADDPKLVLFSHKVLFQSKEACTAQRRRTNLSEPEAPRPP